MIPVLVVLLGLIVVPASSAALQRPFKEVFSSAEKPEVGETSAVVVDQETGDVLVGVEGTRSIMRFHADGTPAPFAALGTNAIDGAEANGKPCAEEPASCDQTPQNGISIVGSISSVYQIAIDESGGPTDGDIYLTQRSPQPGLVDIFSADGRYLGQVTEAGTRPFGNEPAGVAIDDTGAVYINATGTIYKFVPQANANRVVNTDLTSTFTRPGENSWELGIGTGPSTGSLFVVSQHDRKKGGGTKPVESIIQLNKETGEFISQFANEQSFGRWMTVNRQTGNVITGAGTEYDFPAGSEPTQVSRIVFNGMIRGGIAATPTNEILVGELFPTSLSVYGPPAVVPNVGIDSPSDVTGTRANVTGTVDPVGGPAVTKCVFEYGKANEVGGPNFPEIVVSYESEAPCEGLNATGPSTVHSTLQGLESNGQMYGVRIRAYNEDGREETTAQIFTTASTVVTEPADEIGLTKATLHGTVLPEGSTYTECFFQYGLLTTPVYEKTVPCAPEAAELPANFAPQKVHAAISGLQGGSLYRVRLVTSNGALGTVDGNEATFTTLGLPAVDEIRAGGADGSSVTLEAEINPRGFDTSVGFEWGPTAAYGNITPITSIGGGTEPTLTKATISGLAAGSTFHYRVVATNGAGAVRSTDQIAETLNSCGLPEGRCFELVSRNEAGPVAIPGESNAHVEMHFQAATTGSGALAYPVESGYPEATKGADVLYRGTRGNNGWDSVQLSSPIVAPNERNDVTSVSNATEWLSNDLSCGFTDSIQPLTPDPSMKLVRESGGSNLYRINPDNSYTPISTLPPENAEGFNAVPDYNVVGASQNCDMTLFNTRYAYSGIPTGKATNSKLYEWRNGTLRNAALVPGPVGEVPVEATAGLENVTLNADDTQNAVSENGSRIFFSAIRQTSSNPGEIGRRAVFVRENGSKTRDVSLSETSVPDEEAQYQWATADGSKVFFIANAGLTAETNSEGMDLYEYNLQTNKLTDRSVTSAEGGADVVGFLTAATDGSRVFFASSNQLVSGSGNTRAQNEDRQQLSVYGEKGGQISFVGTINEHDGTYTFISHQNEWTSQASPDGRYLLFESTADVTGYESEGQLEAYLFDAEGGAQKTICISCRQDGGPPLPRFLESAPLARGFQLWNPLHPPRFLTMHDGEPQVFFSSPDVLAPGSTEDQNNIYEWSHGQIFRLVSAAAGAQKEPLSGNGAMFGGASDDGSDVYLITPETLNREDGDERGSAYDARVGGGFPQPSVPPGPCEATAENSCQGPPGAVVGPSGAATTGDSGSQNVVPKKKSPAKKKHRKKSKHKKKNSKKSKKSNHKRNKGSKSKRKANGDRRKGK